MVVPEGSSKRVLACRDLVTPQGSSRVAGGKRSATPGTYPNQYLPPLPLGEGPGVRATPFRICRPYGLCLSAILAFRVMDSPQDISVSPKVYKWKSALTFAAIFGGLTIFLDYYAVSPNGSAEILNLHLFTGISVLAAFFMALKSGFAVLRRQTRYVGFKNFLICLTFVVAMVGSERIGNRIRMHAFAGLAQRSEPLVAAIKSYELKYGKPPDSLEALIPEFLPAVPRTGMGAYPEYRYLIADENRGDNDGNPWVIIVNTPTGILNSDRFFYYPLQNYPSQLWETNPVERIRDWAYLPE